MSFNRHNPWGTSMGPIEEPSPASPSPATTGSGPLSEDFLTDGSLDIEERKGDWYVVIGPRDRRDGALATAHQIHKGLIALQATTGSGTPTEETIKTDATFYAEVRARLELRLKSAWASKSEEQVEEVVRSNLLAMQILGVPPIEGEWPEELNPLLPPSSDD